MQGLHRFALGGSLLRPLLKAAVFCGLPDGVGVAFHGAGVVGIAKPNGLVAPPGAGWAGHSRELYRFSSEIKGREVIAT